MNIQLKIIDSDKNKTSFTVVSVKIFKLFIYSISLLIVYIGYFN